MADDVQVSEASQGSMFRAISQGRKGRGGSGSGAVLSWKVCLDYPTLDLLWSAFEPAYLHGSSQ